MISKPNPSLFISHGAPDLILHPHPATEFLKQLGTQLKPPQSILVISAHWTTEYPTISITKNPETIHDFYGFPASLYQLSYQAPGAVELAQTVDALLTKAGFSSRLDAQRGLDHGAWEPLMLMYPQAEIPVTQLSIQPHLGTQYHYRLGEALAPLRHQNVLILTSGGITHNLSELKGNSRESQPPAWVTEFDRWMAEAIANNSCENLLNYRHLAPYAIKNHPSEEHLLPLFVAMGAGGSLSTGKLLHHSFTYSILSMAAYGFEES